MDPPPIKKNSDGLYYHAGAVMSQDSDDLKVKFYQFPAWTQLDTPPDNPQLDTIVSDTISTSYTSLQPHWAGNVPISQDEVTTDYAPAIAAWDDILYMFYADGSSSKNPPLSLCTANAAGLTPEDTAIWGAPNAITVNGKGVTEKTSTAIIAVDGILYGFYLDDNDNIQCISCATSGDVTSWTTFGSINDTVIGMSACFFQGCIYVVYLKSSNYLHWVYYNVTTEDWGNMGKLADTDGEGIQSNIAPAVCADATRIYLIYQQYGNTDIRWAIGAVAATYVSEGDPNKISWSDQGDIESIYEKNPTNPDTSIGMAMCYGSGAFYMVYASTNSDLTLCALEGADEKQPGRWVGKSTIKPVDLDKKNQSTAQTSQCPAMVVTSGGGFLVYRGATHDEIYWAYY